MDYVSPSVNDHQLRAAACSLLRSSTQLTVSTIQPTDRIIGIERRILFDWPICCNVRWKSFRNRSLSILVVPHLERAREIGHVHIDVWRSIFWKMSYVASTCNYVTDCPLMASLEIEMKLICPAEMISLFIYRLSRWFISIPGSEQIIEK